MTSDLDSAPSAPESLAPLTIERITDALRRREVKFAIDSDGDPVGDWADVRIYFFSTGEQGEILQVRAYWRHKPPLALRSQFLDAINQWHNDKIWPKAYLSAEDDHLRIICEVAVDLEHGATDAQLDQLISCGISTSVRFSDYLSEKFGHREIWTAPEA